MYAAILTDQPDYDKARKYWNNLKQRLTEEGFESVTNCHQLKLVSRLSFFKQVAERYSRKQIAECYMVMGGVNTNVFSWFGKGDNRKAQIDLLIDRADKSVVVTIRTPHMVSPQQLTF